ncbi:negative transcriptional regulator, PaiB family [Paramicrobacterium humi]|uniref:Negative transcriptional regulator, PaiB family n=1 Tax=Paramicrobacterium humi TaxID=640635 RepID=A0A1H4LWN4_9MICO|nr:FMN-binding negative transcriptional regulator [Microbacterium humi]SEB74642.1 negative transcriptional regulator, PaiB family [Microbacterium humi]
MWINKQYEVENALTWLESFVADNNLSTIITHDPVRVAHMPVEIVRRESGEAKLLFHMPTVDPIAKAISESDLLTVVVHGPQQYISPSLYGDAGLPTFNYGIGEVTDKCRQLDETELADHLHRLITQREEWFAGQTERTAWVIDPVNQERFDRLLPMLVGFEVDLENVQLKLKMGQNRTIEDRKQTVEILRTTPGVDWRVTDIMAALLPQSATPMQAKPAKRDQ